jgi:hypothetical protein
MKSKKKTKAENKETPNKLSAIEIEEKRESLFNELIVGDFVKAWSKIPECTEDFNFTIYIRLSEIKTIEHVWCFEEDGGDGCYFNTYKDHKYFTYLKARILVAALSKTTINTNKTSKSEPKDSE